MTGDSPAAPGPIYSRDLFDAAMPEGTVSAPARLFYDPGCGPCTLFAKASEWTSRSRVRAVPYDGPEADRELGDLSDEVRFASAHLVDRTGRSSGPEILPPLVALTAGRTAGRVVGRVPTVDQGLRWLYLRFWNYRQVHGCGTAEGTRSSRAG